MFQPLICIILLYISVSGQWPPKQSCIHRFLYNYLWKISLDIIQSDKTDDMTNDKEDKPNETEGSEEE